MSREESEGYHLFKKVLEEHLHDESRDKVMTEEQMHHCAKLTAKIIRHSDMTHDEVVNLCIEILSRCKINKSP